MWTRRFFAMLSCALAAGAGCEVGPDYHPPQTAAPSVWEAATQPAATQPAAITLHSPDLSAWWRILHDRMLNELVAQAISSNFDLQVAEARVREARALRDVVAA